MTDTSSVHNAEASQPPTPDMRDAQRMRRADVVVAAATLIVPLPMLVTYFLMARGLSREIAASQASIRAHFENRRRRAAEKERRHREEAEKKAREQARKAAEKKKFIQACRKRSCGYIQFGVFSCEERYRRKQPPMIHCWQPFKNLADVDEALDSVSGVTLMMERRSIATNRLLLLTLPFIFAALYMLVLWLTRRLTHLVIRWVKARVNSRCRIIFFRPFDAELASVGTQTVIPVLARFGELVITRDPRAQMEAEADRTFRTDQELLADGGAAMSYFDGAWQAGALAELDMVDYVVIDLSLPTPNVVWELQSALARFPLERLIILAHDRSPVATRMADRLRQATAGSSLSVDLIRYEGGKEGEERLHEAIERTFEARTQTGSGESTAAGMESDHVLDALVEGVADCMATHKHWRLAPAEPAGSWLSRFFDLNRATIAVYLAAGLATLLFYPSVGLFLCAMAGTQWLFSLLSSGSFI